MLRPGIIWLRRALLTASVCWAVHAPQAASTNPYQRVVVYYDTNGVSSGAIREVHQLNNALGHFRTFVTNRPLGAYAAGDLAGYDVGFYLGNSTTVTLPPAFLGDLAAGTSRFVWVSQNVRQLLESTNNVARFGLSYVARTAGYSRVTYKGEDLDRMNVNDRIVAVAASNYAAVLATTFSHTNPAVPVRPYAVHSSNFWYFADSPFLDSSAVDRKLVFHDVLHDVLRSGAPTNHRALVRIEDVNPGLTSLSALTAIVTSLQARGVSPTLAVIPRYRDPQGLYTNSIPPDRSLTDHADFSRALIALQRAGAQIVAHGYTHQNDEENEISGNGWEFWNSAAKKPLTNDSPAWAAQRVNASLAEFSRQGFDVRTWETPHYTASLLDVHVFHERTGVQYERIPCYETWIEGLTPEQLAAASSNNPPLTLQYLPYVCYRSIYGSRFLPENLDYHSPSGTDANGRLLNVSNKVAYARQMKVVRDAVVSFYYHTYFGTNSIPVLTNLVGQIQAEGYTFTDMETLLREEPP